MSRKELMPFELAVVFPSRDVPLCVGTIIRVPRTPEGEALLAAQVMQTLGTARVWRLHSATCRKTGQRIGGSAWRLDDEHIVDVDFEYGARRCTLRCLNREDSAAMDRLWTLVSKWMSEQSLVGLSWPNSKAESETVEGDQND